MTQPLQRHDDPHRKNHLRSRGPEVDNNVVSLKPILQFQDTCGLQLATTPTTQNVVTEVCRMLGIARAAIETESQLIAAVKFIFTQERDAEVLLGTMRKLLDARLAGVISEHEGRNDLVGITTTAIARDMLAGKRIPAKRQEHFHRLQRQALHAQGLTHIHRSSWMDIAMAELQSRVNHLLDQGE